MLARDLTHAKPRRLRRAEYDRMAQLGFFRHERVELIRGTVVAMSPIGPPHSSVVDRLTRLLVRALDPRALVRIQQPFLACDESEPEPDVAVVPDGVYADAHPDRAFLIIEVAESSLDYDRETKGPVYASSGVDEYWIVDVAARAIEVYSHPVNGRYRNLHTIDNDGSVAIAAFPDVTVEVPTLFP